MHTQQLGAELNQMAKYLFDSAANKWYLGICLQIIAGLISITMGVVTLPGQIIVFGAAFVTLLIVIAYILRLGSSRQYSLAETMRRQSVLTEALDWPISKSQMGIWRQKAGEKILKKVKSQPRDSEYYSTNQSGFGPQKLAEMTIESAFYTWNLYANLQSIIWVIFGITILAAYLVISVALSSLIPQDIVIIVAKVIYSLIPIVLAVDLLGWALKLGWTVPAIQNIESSLENLEGKQDLNIPQVLRLVAEYNCQVVQGLPIHNWLFNKWHPSIKNLWEQR